MRSIITISFLFLSCVAWSQRYGIVTQELCWNTGSVDSSITRYILVSTRSTEVKSLTYLNASGQGVDVSGGGTFSQGHCGCCGGGSGSSGGDGQGLVNAKNGLSLEGDSVILGGILKMNTTIAGMDTYGLDLTTLSYLTLSGSDSLRIITPDLLSAVADIGGVLQLNSATGRVQYTPYAFPLVIGTNGQYMEWDAVGDSLKWTSPYITAVATDSSYRFSVNGSSTSEVLFKNIYTQDDTLTSNRTAHLDGKRLVFYDTGNGYFQLISGRELGMFSIKMPGATDSLVFKFDYGLGSDYGFFLEGPGGLREIFSTTGSTLSWGTGYSSILLDENALPNDTNTVPTLLSIDPVTEKIQKLPSSSIKGTQYTEDIGRLELIHDKIPGVGLGANESVANYDFSTVNAQKYKFSGTEPYGIGGEYGGWLANGTSGDSIFVSVPSWVVIGDSQAEGHTGKHGRLHPNGVAGFDANYPDSIGQLSYHLRELTHLRFFNQGIGSESSNDTWARWRRDVLAEEFDVGDGRGSRTLQRKPQGVIIITGINDFYLGGDVQQVKDNLSNMAASANANDIKCVVLNIGVADGNNPIQNAQTDSINSWLATGGLTPYGAVVVDYNSFGRDPNYDDNIHFNSTYISADGIHPTPVGYDSLAALIYRTAKLPRLDSLIIHTQIGPSGLAGYSRPTSIRVDGSTTYALTDSIMSIPITQAMSSDSVSIHILASSNITGTNYTGISHVEWLTSNRYAGSEIITRKQSTYSGLANSFWGKSGSNLSPAGNETVSIGESGQHSSLTTFTLKGKQSSENSDMVVFKNADNTITHVFRHDGKVGINRSSPTSWLDVNGTVIFRNGSTYSFFNGSTGQFWGPSPQLTFQTDQNGRDDYTLQYTPGVFSFSPPTGANGSETKVRIGSYNDGDGSVIVLDPDAGEIGIGTDAPQASIDTDGDILLSGSDDGTSAGKLILQERLNVSTGHVSLRSQDTDIQTDYSLPEGGASTYGKFLKNNTGDSTSWDTPIASDIAITDAGGYYTSTDVEGALQELAINQGSESASTDGSGDLTISHGLGTATVFVTAAATGTTFYNVQVHTKTSTDFKIRFFDATGAAVTSTAVTVDWIARR